MPEPLFTRPVPTYPISYTGIIQPGGWTAGPGKEITIPHLHQRIGDTKPNRVVEYLVTFPVSTGTFVTGQSVSVYDNSNVAGVNISGANSAFPWKFNQQEDLRLACENYATTYFVMAFYEKPSDR